jgi:hypothetical protein
LLLSAGRAAAVFADLTATFFDEVGTHALWTQWYRGDRFDHLFHRFITYNINVLG